MSPHRFSSRRRTLTPLLASDTAASERAVAKLIALVPPPGVATVRYAGVFSNAHHLRAAVAPCRGSAQGLLAHWTVLSEAALRALFAHLKTWDGSNPSSNRSP